jgi:hypothetical protein
VEVKRDGVGVVWGRKQLAWKPEDEVLLTQRLFSLVPEQPNCPVRINSPRAKLHADFGRLQTRFNVQPAVL